MSMCVFACFVFVSRCSFVCNFGNWALERVCCLLARKATWSLNIFAGKTGFDRLANMSATRSHVMIASLGRSVGRSQCATRSVSTSSISEGSAPQPTTTISSASEIPSSSQMTPRYFKITQIRSAIGLPQKTSQILESLGLRRRMQTVYQLQTPEAMGKILKVKELVRVESNLESAEHPDAESWRRKAPKGYEVIGSAL